jgi:hypothetical protein
VAALIVTIDTEPDLPVRRQSTHTSLRNIPALRQLQERMPDVKLTLLVTQSVLDDPPSRKVLEELATGYGAEIGAHLHPEDTPPFLPREAERRETSLLRLPLEVRAQKLETLCAAIYTDFPPPTSYRAGRWKLSPEDFKVLKQQGIQVDTTVTPYISWRLEKGPDWSGVGPEPYRDAPSGLWEVPVTIGLNRGTALARTGLLRPYLQLASHPAKGLKPPLDRLWSLGRPIQPVWFRPTYTPLDQLKRLGQRILRRSPDPVLNMMFHSNELVIGGRPFIREQADADRVADRIVEACRYFSEQLGVKSTTLSAWVQQRTPAPEAPVPA